MTARRNTVSLPIPKKPLDKPLAANLRLFRFEACDDDTEFYVRALSREAAFRVLEERGRMKKLRLQPRTCTALDTKP